MSFFSKFQKYDFPNFGYVRLPAVELSKEEREMVGVTAGASNAEFLRALTRKGYKDALPFMPTDKVQAYAERAKRELDTVEKLGFVDYFLLVWKTCSRADKKNISRDYGRGSCAGSLVFYLINVTEVDPIRYDLFFERFISETRAKKKVIDGITYIDGGLAPDVDLDFEQARRAEVIEDLKSTYPGRVCSISTQSTLSGKALIKECGKAVLGLPEDEMKRVSDMIPKEFGLVWDIEEAYGGKRDKKNPEEWERKPVDEFKAWCDAHPEVYEVALGLRDLIKNKGTHPSGFVVSYDLLNSYIPVEMTKSEKDEDEGLDEEYSTSSAFAMEDVAYLTIKLDLLGVTCCSVVAETLKLTKVNHKHVNIDSDPIIYDNLQNLRTPHGIFQIEAPTNLKVCQEVKPKNLSELSDVLAIARPGALSFLKKYASNECEPVFETFDPILLRTRGVCLYQEQMMKLAHAIGFTLEEAEILRRVVGKKKVDEVQAWQEKIKAKIKENNLPDFVGELLWKILEDSSKYSFNLSHSLSYASLSALTTYLKFKHPLEFFLALLKQVKNKPKYLERIAIIESELKHFGIKLLPPDLLKSGIDFEIQDGNIRFGLSSIKGISEKTIAHLLEFKAPKSNRFQLFESAKSAGLNVSVLCALIHCGCLDSVAHTASRGSIALQAQLWNILTAKEKTLALELGEKFKYNLFEVFRHLKVTNNEKGKPYIAEKRLGTIMKKYEPKKAIFLQNDSQKELCNFFYERMLLGYSYSVRLASIFEEYFANLMTVNEVLDAADGTKVSFVAVVLDKPVERTSANKNKYGKWSLSDETGIINGMIFNNKQGAKLDEIKLKHDGKLPTKDAIVYVHGQKKGDSIFINNMADQCMKIYTKFAQMEKDSGQTEQSE